MEIGKFYFKMMSWGKWSIVFPTERVEEKGLDLNGCLFGYVFDLNEVRYLNEVCEKQLL